MPPSSNALLVSDNAIALDVAVDSFGTVLRYCVKCPVKYRYATINSTINHKIPMRTNVLRTIVILMHHALRLRG